MAKLSELKKTELLEAAVLEGNVEKVRNLFSEHGSFEFTARALGIACRFLGAEMARCLIDCGATFQYEATGAMVRKYKCTYAINSRSECNIAYDYECYLVGQSIGLDKEHSTMQVLSASERAAMVRLLCQYRETTKVKLAEMLYQGIMNCEWEVVSALKECGVTQLPDSRIAQLAASRAYTANEQHEDYCFSNRLSAMNEINLLRTLKELTAAMAGKTLLLSPDDVLERHWGEPDRFKSIWCTPGVFETAKECTNLIDRAKKCKWDTVKALVEKSNAAGLMWAINEGWVSKADDFKKLFEHSQKNEVSPDLTAVLLKYHNPQMEGAKKSRKKTDELTLDDNPFSSADLKKIWGTKKQEDGTLIITSYKGTEIDVVVPAMIGKSAVTAIEGGAFSPFAPRLKTEQVDARKAIRSVEFLANIRELPERLFFHGYIDAHGALEQVILPEGLEIIGKSCFDGCSGLKEIKLPRSLKKINFWAFHGCANLEEVFIPESVEKIDDDAFGGCRKLKKIHLPQSITRLPNFVQCGFEEFIVPPHITELSDLCFSHCYSLRRVVLHDGIQTIPDRCFDNTALESIELPASVTCIGEEAFANCRELHYFDIPDTVTDVAENAFAGSPHFKNEQGTVVIRGVLHSYNGKNENILCLDRAVRSVARDAVSSLPDIVYRAETVREDPIPDISALQVGETVMLGRFIQDLTLEMRPIAWRVIAEEDGKKLLLADKGLVKIGSGMDIEEPSWEKCRLRTQLCRNFMQVAFDDEERSHIQPVVLSNKGRKEDGIPDSADTQEMVFPLSLDELEKYLPDACMKVAQWTEYVDVRVAPNGLDSRRMYWLLRTRGKKKNFVQLCVNCRNGWLSQYVRGISYMVFRPAMWVK